MNSDKPDIEKLITEMDKVSADLRLEVLLHELLRNECLKDSQVWIEPKGIFNRGFLKDMGKIELKNREKESEKLLAIPVYREGLFDALPIGLFHQPQSRKYNKSADVIGRELQIQAREEEAARDFFLPVEQEYYRLRLALEARERSLFEGYANPEGINLIFSRFWGLELKGIDKHQLTLLLDALTLSYPCKGWISKVEQLFRLVTRKDLVIELVAGKPIPGPPNLNVPLGEACLGLNTVLGGDLEDGLGMIRITFTSLSRDEVMDYLPGQPQDQVLRILEAFFLPADTRAIYKFDLVQEDRQFVLGSSRQPAILGYSSYLPEASAA